MDDIKLSCAFAGFVLVAKMVSSRVMITTKEIVEKKVLQFIDFAERVPMLFKLLKMQKTSDRGNFQYT